MLSEIELTEKKREGAFSVQFFPIPTETFSTEHPVVLASKVGVFFEYLINKSCDEHRMEDAPSTKFHINEKNSTAYVASFLVCLMELLPETYAIKSILIHMMIYLDRYFEGQANDWLHRFNFKTLLFCSACLALKTLGDELDYEPVLKLNTVTREFLEELKEEFLIGLDHNITISEHLYETICDFLDNYEPTCCVDDKTDELRGLAFV